MAKKYEYDYEKRRPKTPGGRFMKYMSETFVKALDAKGENKHSMYRKLADIVSAPTFYRIIDGKSGANVGIIAEIADRLGFELRLVPKTDNQINIENEDNDR